MLFRSEYGVSIPSHYAAIIQELREDKRLIELGGTITDFRDYDRLVKLSTNDKFAQEEEKKLLLE